MKFSLRNLLIVPFLLQVIGITGLVGYLSYRSGQQAVQDMARQMMTITDQRARENLDAYLQTSRFVAQTNAHLLETGRFSSNNLADLESHLVKQLQLFPELTGLVVTNEAGAFLNVVRQASPDSFLVKQRNVAVVDNRLYRYRLDIANQAKTLLPPIRQGYDPHRDPPDDPWYVAAQTRPEGLWRLVVSPERGDDQPRLVMVRFVPFQTPGGGFGGVFSTDILLTQLGKFLQSLLPSDEGQIFLIEPDGYLVATSTGEPPFDQQLRSDAAHPAALPSRLAVEQSRNPLTRSVAVSLMADYGGLENVRSPRFSHLRFDQKQYFVQTTPLQGELNWLLVTVVPASEFMADINANTARTALLCALALIGSISLGLWTAEYIAKPILSLQRATQALTNGLATVPPTQPSTIQEVEALRQGFDRMVGQLVSSFYALKDRENTLATFLNGVPVALSVHDQAGQMLFLNAKGKELLVSGLTTADAEPLAATYQLYRAGSDEPYPTDDLPVVRGLRGETAYTDDIEVQTGDRRIPLEVHTIPVFNSLGQVLYSINTFQDITERRQVERFRVDYQRELELQVAQQMAFLAASEATQKALINAIPDLLMRLGRDGRPLAIYNPEAVNWLGDRNQLYEKSMYENLPGPIAQERQRCVDLALETGSIQRQEYEFVSAGQTFYEEARIIPVTQDEVLVVVRDISDRYRIDRLKDEFISIISHELRTPLTAIRGALGILEAGVLHNRPQKTQQMLSMALSNTERLIRLVNDILDLERLTSGRIELNLEPCPLEELMTLAVNGVESIALEANVTIQVTPAAATVLVAPDAVVQTLTNLLGNAIKFSEAGSKIWLTATLVSTPRAIAAPDTIGDQPGWARVAVKDQGRGIPADRLEMIFERFQQVDVSDSRQRGGTGLGLAICKQIVEQHGGEIWVESQVGRGSTFFFTLPLKRV